MRILVLGGTYFLGKAFVEIACREHEITLINRGNRKVRFGCPGHIRQLTMDRHLLEKNCLASEHYDVVVDFCAYERGDIRQVVEAIGGKTEQYIFISTVDVYKRGTGRPLDEAGELETRDFGGPAGAYILGKVALEKELRELAETGEVSCNSIRPVFIYGPDNYARREDIFFNWIEQAGQILYPQDATGSFQMVYVEDLAGIILKLCGNPAINNRNLNICGNKVLNYESFCDALTYATGKDFERVPISVEDVLEKQIPLPFPLTGEESEIYVTGEDGLSDQSYIELKEGLRLTYRKRKEREIFQTIDALFDENKPKEAERYMLDMLKEAKEASEDMVTLKLLNELIGYYRQTSEAQKLLAVIEESLALAAHMKLEGTIEYATTTLNAANAFRSLGKLTEAKQYYETTEKIYRENIRLGNLDSNDMLVAGLYNNISLLLQEISRPEEALAYLEKALDISMENHAGFEIATTYANLANTSLLTKQYEKAGGYAETAKRLFEERGLRDPHYCAALSALGTCCFELGEVEKARDIFEEAMKIVEETIGKNRQYERLKMNLEKCNAVLASGER